jgi:hypothetical protein
MKEMKKNDDELGSYKTLGLSLLQFMALLAILGIVVTVALKLFFNHS